MKRNLIIILDYIRKEYSNRFCIRFFSLYEAKLFINQFCVNKLKFNLLIQENKHKRINRKRIFKYFYNLNKLLYNKTVIDEKEFQYYLFNYIKNNKNIYVEIVLKKEVNTVNFYHMLIDKLATINNNYILFYKIRNNQFYYKFLKNYENNY